MVAGRSVLAHSLAALAGVSRLAQVVVLVSPDDSHIDRFAWDGALGSAPPCVLARCAGATRAHTVANGLAWLSAQGAEPHDWVLVHDAARCLVTSDQVNRLMDACLADAVGGLLAHKLPDTLKTCREGRVAATVPREDKWLAQTPQMFRLGDLSRALSLSQPSDHAHITDEASAMEAVGLSPLLVESGAENFKLTYPADFAMAEAILRARGAGSSTHEQRL
jgi:2-C-methyl-D-erythritol 4-phosphate cytidylyltransferase